MAKKENVAENTELRSHCPVNYALEMVGDRWALLILRDMVFRGRRTYGEFLASEEKIATNILSTRLRQLKERGILQQAKRKGPYELTEKGLDLIPLLFEMVLWSSKYDPHSEAARIPRLVELIEKNNRKVSEEVISQVRRGEPVVKNYL
ncbi:helix-turn-helix domain-containing protein [Thalassoglobus sp. JC818]|uniref:winged helix-turn-helix transcriptional regulator n=1 Tax=Thalassoglobus sp. JC818 TaxID=3232136 RepID=UPI00345A50D6